MTNIAYIAIGGENKILCFALNEESGALTLHDEILLGGAPGPLAVDPSQQLLYVGLRSTREIVSFRIETDGGLTPFGAAVALSADPCYLSTDHQGRYLLAAYYGAGKVTVHPLGTDGSVGSAAVCEVITAERAHCIQTDRTNRFVFVPHTAGPNLIFQFKFDAETGQLTPNQPPTLAPPPGEGPRHYLFHPSRDIVYFSNEQGCSVTAYHFDATAGTLSPFQTLSTLPDGFTGDNTCAQIHIHPSGRFLYVSNRGHDSIACFAIDERTGTLTSLGQRLTEPVPRAFNLDPAGHFLLAAGQGSGQLATYRIGGEQGTLHYLATYPIGERPMWVMVLSL